MSWAYDTTCLQDDSDDSDASADGEWVDVQSSGGEEEEGEEESDADEGEEGSEDEEGEEKEEQVRQLPIKFSYNFSDIEVHELKTSKSLQFQRFVKNLI